MRVLLYKDLNTRRVKAAFAKVRAFLEADPLVSASFSSSRLSLSITAISAYCNPLSW